MDFGEVYSTSDHPRNKPPSSFIDSYGNKTPVSSILEKYRSGLPPASGSTSSPHRTNRHWSPAKSFSARLTSPSKRGFVRVERVGATKTPTTRTTETGRVPISHRAVADILARYTPSPTATTTIGRSPEHTPLPTRRTTATAQVNTLSSRIRHLAHGSSSTSRRSPGVTPYQRRRAGGEDDDNEDEDFKIGAVRTAADLSITLQGSQLISASNRANELQAQLSLKDLELEALRDESGQLRKERDALHHRLKHQGADLESVQHAKLSLEMVAKQAQREADAARATAAAARAEADALRTAMSERAAGNASETATASAAAAAAAAVATAQELAELRRTNSELQKQVNIQEVELKELQSRMGREQDRAQAKDDHVRALQRQLEDIELVSDERRSPLFKEARRLAAELRASEDRCAAAEAALKEERSRATTRQDYSEASQRADAALTHQVRTLATQLREAQQEAATLRKQLTSDRNASQNQVTSLDNRIDELVAAHSRAEAALHAAEGDLIDKSQQLEEARGTVVKVNEENAALRAALKQRDAQVLQNSHTMVDADTRVEDLERDAARMQAELRTCRLRIIELEDLLARSGVSIHPTSQDSTLKNGTSSAHSPLRDVVTTLRADLHDRELRLAAALEEAETERHRAEELHQRMLDQALELDDLEDRAMPLRQQLSTALERQRTAEERVRVLEHSLEEERSKSLSHPRVQALMAELQGARQEVAVLKKEREALRVECETRERELMQLQGQMQLLEGREDHVENWLMTL